MCIPLRFVFLRGKYAQDHSWVLHAYIRSGAGHRNGCTLYFGRNTKGVPHWLSPKFWTFGMTKTFNKVPTPKWA